MDKITENSELSAEKMHLFDPLSSLLMSTSNQIMTLTLILLNKTYQCLYHSTVSLKN